MFVFVNGPNTIFHNDFYVNNVYDLIGSCVCFQQFLQFAVGCVLPSNTNALSGKRILHENVQGPRENRGVKK